MDVRGSSGLAERSSAVDFAGLMNHFYRVATDILIAHDAIIDKMVGDEVMALFLPGYCGSDYARHAVESAVDLMLALSTAGQGDTGLPLGAGIHTGPAYVGNVGSGGITDFTALGDTVNAAARLQAEAGPGEIVLSDSVYRFVEQWYPDLEARTITLRGREQPIAVRLLRPA